MTFNQETALKKISRLGRKVKILETMIEDHSREAYSENVKRSIINSILELSLKTNNKTIFLQRLLDMLVNTDILQIKGKGAMFLLDRDNKTLVMQVQTGLTEAEQDICQRVELGRCLCGKAAADGAILFADHIDQQHEISWPNMVPHGHYCVPIKNASNVLGLLSIQIAEKTPREDETVQFLSTVADIAAGTLERIQYAVELAEYQKGLERKVVEQVRQIEMEKEQLAVTLRSIGDGVITTDTECRVTMLNPVSEQLTGWAMEDAMGRPLADVFNIINEITREKCSNPAEQVLRDGLTVGLGKHPILISKNGTELSIADSGAPIRDRNAKIIGVVLVFRDVTEQLMVEEQLLKSKKLESIGILAGGIAHDFNNILSAILGNIELATYRVERDLQTSSLLADAQKAAKRAAKLTQQLLTFSKGGDPVRETTPLPNLISESADFVLHGSNVSCGYVFPDDLWAVNVDSGQFGQVVQNITLNAKHAMPEGGQINISCENIVEIASESLLNMNEGAFVRITFHDTGIGIPKETLHKIFDPYFTTKKEGSGLGLAICHSIIDKHGGQITVHSSSTKGTTFSVYLPAAPSPDVSEAKQPKSGPALKAARILVMDDEKMILDLVQMQLSTLGHEAFLVADGEQALNKYQELRDMGTPVDLVIMDLTIPGGMGGQETAKRLLQLDPQAKIIVASGYSNDPVMSNFQEYGFLSAIVKPFELVELRKGLELALG